MALPINNTRGALLALLSFGLYATHDLIVKFLGGIYSPMQLIFYGGLFGFPLVCLMLIRDKTDGHLRPRHPWWLLLRSVAGATTAVLGFYAFSVLPMATAYAIFFAQPLLITLLAIPLLGERVGFRRAMAVIVGLIGVVVVLRPGGGDGLTVGHLAALGAACTGALSSIIVRKIGSEERSVVMMVYPMLVAFVCMAVTLPWVYKPMPVAHLGLLAVFATLGFVATLCLIQAYRSAEAVIVAPMQYSQIIWAVIFGALLFDETPDAWTIAGSTIIIASGIYIVLREARVSRTRPVMAAKSRPETGFLPRLVARMAGDAAPKDQALAPRKGNR
jgi:S-adenosylmethionine uptake transporter